MANKAVFLDRDGTINRMLENDYVKTWEEFEFLPGAAEAIRVIKSEGYLVIVVTNQRGIGRGVMTREDLEHIHRRMCDELASAGAYIDDTFYCPHNIEDDCECRKPRPALLLQAQAKWDIDFGRSFLIGDMDSDIEAGRAVGCATIKVQTNKGITIADLEAVP